MKKVKKSKVHLEFKEKTPVNIKQGIEALKEIAVSREVRPRNKKVG